MTVMPGVKGRIIAVKRENIDEFRQSLQPEACTQPAGPFPGLVAWSRAPTVVKGLIVKLGPAHHASAHGLLIYLSRRREWR